jgi:ATP-binding cassette subfamily B protein
VRRQSATVHELAQVELLAGLPGETLAALGERMERRQLAPGEGVVSEGEAGDRFYVVIAGVLQAAQADRGERGLLRPGDYFGEVALLMDVPRTASVRAVGPATVASCDRETFDELVRPVFTS